MKHRLRLLLCALCLLPLFGAVKAQANYDLIVASDLHYIAPSLTDGGAYYQQILKKGDSKGPLP